MDCAVRPEHCSLYVLAAACPLRSDSAFSLPISSSAWCFSLSFKRGSCTFKFSVVLIHSKSAVIHCISLHFLVAVLELVLFLAFDLFDFQVEALVSDYGGNEDCVRKVSLSGLDVYAHNIETVERLQVCFLRYCCPCKEDALQRIERVNAQHRDSEKTSGVFQILLLFWSK